MKIRDALRGAADEAGWSPARIAVAVELTEASVRAWLNGKSLPSSDNMILLMHKLPGFAERLGFQEMRRAA